MRKRELVHLHTLLALCREDVEDRESVPEAAFEGYVALGIPPSGIDRRKAAHEAAVQALLAGLTTVAAEPPAQSAD